MESINEFPIGSKIELPFVTLEVCESENMKCSSGCFQCFFSNICETLANIEVVEAIVGECIPDCRSDKKDVYFKVIERK